MKFKLFSNLNEQPKLAGEKNLKERKLQKVSRENGKRQKVVADKMMGLRRRRARGKS